VCAWFDRKISFRDNIPIISTLSLTKTKHLCRMSCKWNTPLIALFTVRVRRIHNVVWLPHCKKNVSQEGVPVRVYYSYRILLPTSIFRGGGRVNDNLNEVWHIVARETNLRDGDWRESIPLCQLRILESVCQILVNKIAHVVMFDLKRFWCIFVELREPFMDQFNLHVIYKTLKTCVVWFRKESVGSPEGAVAPSAPLLFVNTGDRCRFVVSRSFSQHSVKSTDANSVFDKLKGL